MIRKAMMISKRSYYIVLSMLIPILVGACQLSESTFLPASPASITQSSISPTMEGSFPASSATPGDVTIWISPAIPPQLRSQIENLQQSRGRTLVITEDSSQADLRVEEFPDRVLTEWIYALVAPFPTISDSITTDELSRIWRGENSLQRVVVNPELFLSLERFWGAPSVGKVEILPPQSTLEYAWENENVWSIIPFGDLEPRWKVIQVNSQSPLHIGFQSIDYPLKVPYGLSGDPALMADIAQQLSWPISNRDPEKMTVVLMTGVTALTRATAWRMNGKGIEYPGLLIREWMRDADFTHVSHEVAFSESCPIANPSQKTLRFCADPDHIRLFEDLEVDLIELTGNHVMDWKEGALLFTLDLYEDREWAVFGGGRNLEEAVQPALIEHHGNRIAWIGCNAAGPTFSWAQIDMPGSTPCSDERVLARVDQLTEQGYLPIFTFQWAESESHTPLPLQLEAFQQAAKAGAVIVQGSQAHRPQTFEFLNGSFIHYGLGNLFFDQMQTWPNRQEFLDRHIFYDGKHISTELLTAILEDYSQPRPATPPEREAMLEEYFQASGW